MASNVIPLRRVIPEPAAKPVRRGRRRQLEVRLMLLESNLETARKAMEVTARMLHEAEERFAEVSQLAR